MPDIRIDSSISFIIERLTPLLEKEDKSTIDTDLYFRIGDAKNISVQANMDKQLKDFDITRFTTIQLISKKVKLVSSDDFEISF